MIFIQMVKLLKKNDVQLFDSSDFHIGRHARKEKKKACKEKISKNKVLSTKNKATLLPGINKPGTKNLKEIQFDDVN